MLDNTALVLVDIQNDFCEGGALAVPGANGIISTANMLIQRAADEGWPIIASRCWHPTETSHFKKWPPHCIAWSDGARFNPNLAVSLDTLIISKGINPGEDAYSAFDGRTKTGYELEDILYELNINNLVVAGLATDYCVYHTVMDALKSNYGVAMYSSGIAAVDEAAGEAAIREMVKAGAVYIGWTMED